MAQDASKRQFLSLIFLVCLNNNNKINNNNNNNNNDNPNDNDNDNNNNDNVAFMTLSYKMYVTTDCRRWWSTDNIVSWE